MSVDSLDPSREPADDLESPIRETILVTGFPAFTARRLCAKILTADADARLHLLIPDKFEDQARTFLAELPGDRGRRARIVFGDVSGMDLGLAGQEYRDLAGAVTTIHHLAEDMAADRDTAHCIHVEGTRNIIEFASETRELRRLCHWSTAAVSGKRTGMILEDELDESQAFHSVHEETRFEAETLARRAQRRLPLTIFRPSTIVGDSRTGEIDKFDGPYYLMVLIAMNATPMRLPLPGRGTAPLNLVPIDYVIDAAYALSRDERAAGKTFHLTDPHPLSARRIYELVAERSHTQPPRGYIPSRVARILLRTPGIARIARGPLSFLDVLDQHVFYDCRHTQELLAGTGIHCPAFDSYVDNLVRYVKDVYAARKESREDEQDPLD